MSSTIALGSGTNVTGWSNIRLTRQLNRASMLTARIPAALAEAQGWTKRLDTTSETTRYEYPNVGPWTGLVTNTTIRDGMLEITAQGDLIRLKKKLLEITADTQNTPGNILTTAVNYYNQIAQGRPLQLVEIDKTTGWVSLSQSWGLDIYDELLPALTDGCGMELLERLNLLTFKQTVGEDLTTTSFVIAAGFNSSACQVISAAVSNDLFSVTNEYRGVGLQRIVTKSAGAAGTQRSVSSRQKVAGGTKATSAAAGAGTVSWQQFRTLVFDSTSIGRWTQLAERRDYPNIRTNETMTSVLNREMAVSKGMYPTMELTLVDIDGAFGRMGLGNTLTVNVAAFGRYKARVMATTLDVDSGTMTASMKVVQAL